MKELKEAINRPPPAAKMNQMKDCDWQLTATYILKKHSTR